MFGQALESCAKLGLRKCRVSVESLQFESQLRRKMSDFGSNYLPNDNKK